jgi:hypothetical protein
MIFNLTSVSVQLAAKEKEMLQLCAIKYPADTPVISLTNQTTQL